MFINSAAPRITLQDGPEVFDLEQQHRLQLLQQLHRQEQQQQQQQQQRQKHSQRRRRQRQQRQRFNTQQVQYRFQALADMPSSGGFPRSALRTSKGGPQHQHQHPHQHFFTHSTLNPVSDKPSWLNHAPSMASGDENFMMEDAYTLPDNHIAEYKSSSSTNPYVSVLPAGKDASASRLVQGIAYPPNDQHYGNCWPPAVNAPHRQTTTTTATSGIYSSFFPEHTPWNSISDPIVNQPDLGQCNSLPIMSVSSSMSTDLSTPMDSINFCKAEPPISAYGSFSSAGTVDMVPDMTQIMMVNGDNGDPSPWPDGICNPGHTPTPSFCPEAGPWGSWGLGAALEPTVSPKLLRLQPSPTPTTSSESVHTSIFTTGDHTDGGSLDHFDGLPAVRQDAVPAPLSVLAPKPVATRKQLPDKPTRPQYTAIMPKRSPKLSGSSSGSGSSHQHKSHDKVAAVSTPYSLDKPLKPKPTTSSHKAASSTITTFDVKTRFVSPAASPHLSFRTPPRSADAFARSSSTSSSANDSVASRAQQKQHQAVLLPQQQDHERQQLTKAEQERQAKDRFLVESKRAGMTYKEIRQQGGFAEAESTLRGRFRTLTKSKEERVRRPEWSEHDIHLLEKAVRKLAKGDDLATAKIPWKQVAEYIFSKGGSYLFGNSTCRKKWDEVVEARKVKGRGRGYN